MGLKLNSKFLKGGEENEFKSDQNGIEIQIKETSTEQLKLVQIRPKWDWNFYFQIGVGANQQGSNQTKMGLKSTWRTINQNMNSSAFKSDQNGIEI